MNQHHPKVRLSVPKMHVILSTRADPPLPMASWRARGQQIEIRAADLRFTSDETIVDLSADGAGSETDALVSLLAMIQTTFAACYGDDSL